MPNVAWTHYGPPRATSIGVPPIPSLIDWYAIDHDPDRGRFVYACRPDDDARGGELWALDGAAWTRVTTKRAGVDEHIHGGAYDTGRRAMVVWSWHHDYEAERELPIGVALSEAGGTVIATTGETPVAESDDGDVGTFDRSGAFAYDRGRSVWVCLTRAGIWELDGAGAWSRRRDGKNIPQSWRGESGDGVYDPVGKRTVFVMQDEDWKIVVLAWDGDALLPIKPTGLPKLVNGGLDPVCQPIGHPEHGLVMHAGAGKLYKLLGTKWMALPVANEPPPVMEKAFAASDGNAIVIGPGKHEDAGGSEYNDVFFVLRGSAWETQGVAVRHSPIKDASYGNCQLAHAGGVWYALGSHSLRTWRWQDDAWREIVDKETGEKIGGWEVMAIVAAGDRLHAVAASGAVFAFDGRAWKPLAKKTPAFKGRTGFALAADPSGRLVVWGGEASGRKLNDTLVFEGKSWRVAKKTSPQPADFKHGRKDDVYVGTTMAFDTAVGAMVRFGFEEVAVLGADDVWTLAKPKGYKTSISQRAYGHAPVHDATTGETLLVDFENGRVSRFDLGGCEVVATIELPAEVMPKKQHDRAGFYALAEAWSYDPAARALFAQVKEDSAGTYRLELGALFDAAKGRRTVPAAAKSKTATTATKVYKVVGGKPEVSAKPKAGFVPAAKLSRDALAELVGVRSCAIAIGKGTKKPPASRLGGVPSGVKAWPKKAGKPMGFLFQLETGDLLAKHAGVAVFCSLDGEATTEDDENAVVLIKKFDKPTAAPAGVPLLSARALTIDDAKIEIDDDRAHALGAKDPDLGAAFERLQTMTGVQRDGLANKLGGLPEFLQGNVAMTGHKFVGQLDFDSINVGKEWPDAGLAGCVYVFVRDDERDAVAFWQYT